MGNQVSFEDIKQLFKETDRRLDERIGKFKRLLPQYRETRLLSAVAAMVVPADAAGHAEKRGLFVVGQAGDDAVFLNSRKRGKKGTFPRGKRGRSQLSQLIEWRPSNISSPDTY